jgi:hypothetical protein
LEVRVNELALRLAKMPGDEVSDKSTLPEKPPTLVAVIVSVAGIPVAILG